MFGEETAVTPARPFLCSDLALCERINGGVVKNEHTVPEQKRNILHRLFGMEHFVSQSSCTHLGEQQAFYKNTLITAHSDLPGITRHDFRGVLAPTAVCSALNQQSELECRNKMIVGYS